MQDLQNHITSATFCLL